MKPPSRYYIIEKGRSFLAILVTALSALVAVLFFIGGTFLLVSGGIIFSLITLRGVVAFIKDDFQHLIIENDILSWNYSRWPKSKGQIDLSTVCYVRLDSDASLSASFTDGTSRRIKVIGSVYEFRDFLRQHYPQIQLEFIEGGA
jgi:hypothetical protein